MSDPVSNSEIEDVLASIRRLVSENAKALKGDRARDPEAEKLVLTPAFRIDEREAAAQEADVFAVDTETWNDASGGVEHAENVGMFSHSARPRPTSADDRAAPFDTAAQADEAVPETAETGTAATAEAWRAAADQDLEAEVAFEDETPIVLPRSEASAVADAESLQADAGAQATAETALEQRIAELETAMDLRVPGDEPPADGADDAGQGADARPARDDASDLDQGADEGGPDDAAIDLDTSEAAPAAPADAVVVPPSDAEPAEAAPETDAAAAASATAPAGDAPDASATARRSWIEGLVAAAAAAETARLAERAEMSRGKDAAADDASKTTAQEPETGPAVAEEDTDADAVDSQSVADAETGAAQANTDEAAGSPAEEAEETGTFELTEAHAAPQEAEGALPGDASVAEALGVVAETDELPDETDETDGVVEETETDEADASEIADIEGGEETAEAASEPAPEAQEPGIPEPDTERSWVDRLISAAATLRSAPTEGDAEGATGSAGPGDTSEEDAAAEPAPAVPDWEAVSEAEELLAGEPGEAFESASDADVEDAGVENVPEPAPEALDWEAVRTPEADADEAPELASDVGTEAPAESEASEPGLAPLSLEDPIEVQPEPDAQAGSSADETEPVDAKGETADAETLPDWEAVEPTDTEERDGAEPIVDLDTVLTGPWTAPVPPTGNGAADAEAEPDAANAEDAAPAAEDVPVGALEWEPVDAPEAAEAETDAAFEPAPSAAEATAAAGIAGAMAAGPSETTDAESEDGPDTAETVEPDIDSADKVFARADDADADRISNLASEIIDDQEVSEETAEEVEPNAEPDSDAIDEDSAAVAAAAEAEADWEDAGMAAAGVAMAGAAGEMEAAADQAVGALSGDAVATDEAAVDDEAVIDEAMLRELVAQLVRDELQGTVGERITHNVRRLIRREIARALTLQDFEK